jgi:hypothetical protein
MGRRLSGLTYLLLMDIVIKLMSAVLIFLKLLLLVATGVFKIKILDLKMLYAVSSWYRGQSGIYIDVLNGFPKLCCYPMLDQKVRNVSAIFTPWYVFNLTCLEFILRHVHTIKTNKFKLLSSHHRLIRIFDVLVHSMLRQPTQVVGIGLWGEQQSARFDAVIDQQFIRDNKPQSI